MFKKSSYGMGRINCNGDCFADNHEEKKMILQQRDVEGNTGYTTACLWICILRQIKSLF